MQYTNQSTDPASSFGPAAKTGHARLLLAGILAWIGVLFMLSSQPAWTWLQQAGEMDKLIHALAFSIAGILIAAWLHAVGIRSSVPKAALLMLIIAVLACADEIHQYFVPGRTADPNDLLADLAGGALVALSILVRRGVELIYAYGDPALHLSHSRFVEQQKSRKRVGE